MLLGAAEILNSLVRQSPDATPTAIAASVPQGLVRVWREVLSHPDSFKETAPTITSGLSFPVDGLHTIMAKRTDDLETVWEPLLDAGILPLLCDSFKVVKSDELMGSLCSMVSSLLLAIPREGAQKYLGRLPHAIAGLIKAKPPVLPGRAAELLYEMA